MAMDTDFVASPPKGMHRNAAQTGKSSLQVMLGLFRNFNLQKIIVLGCSKCIGVLKMMAMKRGKLSFFVIVLEF